MHGPERAAALLALLAGAVAAAPNPSPDPAALAQEAERRAQQYQLSVTPPPPYVDMETVRRLADIGRQRGQQQFNQFMPQQQTSRALSPALGGRSVPPSPNPSLQTPPPGLLVVALSSSMPAQTLREYFAQLDGHRDAVVVLRGFIGGAHAVKPTGQWLEALLRQHGDCRDCGHYRVNVVVDPLAYSGLGIEQVPAIAYLPGVSQLQHCHHEQFKAAALIYGATSIDYALDVARKDGAAIPESVIKGFGGRG